MEEFWGKENQGVIEVSAFPEKDEFDVWLFTEYKEG